MSRVATGLLRDGIDQSGSRVADSDLYFVDPKRLHTARLG
jgi:hypothetical protein